MSYLLCYAGYRYGIASDYEEELKQFAPSPELIGSMPVIPSMSFQGGNTERYFPDVNTEEFETFKDAISQYTRRCLFFREVTLSTINDLTGEGKIIRQFSVSASFIC